jgi:ABC-2 type transport system ATP-binding protein
VAVIDHGRLAALDTPENLIRGLGAEHRVVFTADASVETAALKALPGVTRVEPIGERTIIYGRDDRLAVEVVNFLSTKRIKFRDLRTEQADLEDVFLALTGREMRD